MRGVEGFLRCCSALFSLGRSRCSGKEAQKSGLAKTQRKEETDMLDHISPSTHTFNLSAPNQTTRERRGKEENRKHIFTLRPDMWNLYWECFFSHLVVMELRGYTVPSALSSHEGFADLIITRTPSCWEQQHFHSFMLRLHILCYIKYASLPCEVLYFPVSLSLSFKKTVDWRPHIRVNSPLVFN